MRTQVVRRILQANACVSKQLVSHEMPLRALNYPLRLHDISNPRLVGAAYSSSAKNDADAAGPKDKLVLRGCIFHGYHGVLSEEKTLGQKFVVDMDAWLDLRKAGESDDLRDSVSYADVLSLVQKVVEGPSRNLLESVAHNIARSVFGTFSEVASVRVRLYKLSPPVAGMVDKLGIEIYRNASDF